MSISYFYIETRTCTVFRYGIGVYKTKPMVHWYHNRCYVIELYSHNEIVEYGQVITQFRLASDPDY